jgi:hypothetical protein
MKAICRDLINHSRICVTGLMKTVSQDTRRSSRDSNQARPEHKLEVLGL